MSHFFRPLLLTLLAIASLAHAQPPNIVFIMADDMGYGDVKALNPRSKIPTPNLDRLAREGMRFTDAHSPSAVCTPTRYGVITGRYCWRSRMKRGVLNGYSRPLIDPERPTVASFLSDKGYHTNIVGKWHLGLGFAPEGPQKNFDYSLPLTSTPNDNGFAESYVIPASLDFPPYVFIHNRKVTESTTVQQPAVKFPAFLRSGPRSKALVMENVIDHLNERAIAILKQRAAEPNRPFFLYYPLTAPHKPVLPHPRFVGKSKLGPYGDFVMQVDTTVGKFLDALDETGLTKNTLVIYTSDNGSFMFRNKDKQDHVAEKTVQAYHPDNHTANAQWRGTKADVWEAGHRVPFFARWPGTIKPGSSCAESITHTDLFATCAAIVEQPLPNDGAEDSFSWLPLFKGETWKRAPVINHSANGTFAIRDGNWKLVLANGSGGREAPRGKPFQKPYHLYDLETDPRETMNVIEKYPDIAARLEKTCDELRQAGRSRN